MENLTKENVYVKVESKEQAEMYKAILKSINENNVNGFDTEKYTTHNYKELGIREKGGFWLSRGYSWTYDDGNSSCTEITFGHLIDLLTKPEKIAVRVENEKEFRALMKFYDSKGWESYGNVKPLDFAYAYECITFGDRFFHNTIANFEMSSYKIIPFPDFAKEHNIRLPIITTVDGVDLFDGDYYHAARLEDDGRWYLKFYKNIYSGHLAITRPNTVKAFSTQEAAEKWIEEQNTVECASCEREKQKSEMDSEYPNVCKRCKDDEKATSIAIIWNSILDEVHRAESKHPNWPADKIYAVNIIDEELGELKREANKIQMNEPDASVDNLRKEAIQTAATCIRLLKNL